ncbi:transposase [Streptomyces sp. NPDC127532]|uniref:transposase n=1 Tax=Streptomyces sp. NPDC127532 TaxID=3345399 RepID=UPI00363F631C
MVHCPELEALTGHVRSLGQMLTERQGERLPQWLDAVRRDNLPGLHTLAAGIDRDRDPVIAGLTLPWSSGVVEGHVNRIKMLKHQMFGRAGFNLLRKRVLLYGDHAQRRLAHAIASACDQQRQPNDGEQPSSQAPLLSGALGRDRLGVARHSVRDRRVPASRAYASPRPRSSREGGRRQGLSR